MAESPNLKARDNVSVEILSAGKPIKDTYQVLKILVDYELNIIPTASISLIDGNVAQQDFPAANSDDFIPGKEIEIQAGYDGENKTIFKGIVVNMHLSLDSNVGSVLEISCQDKAILMTQARQNSFYTNQKDSDIISSLIGNHSELVADVEATTHKHNELIQYNTTDWDFMMIRADVNGLVVSINHREISVQPPNVSAEALLSLTYGVDILEFEADLNAVDQVPTVDAVAWDMSKQSITIQSGQEPSTNAIGNLSGKQLGSELGVAAETLRTSANIKADMLKNWANARLLKSRLSSFKGSVTFIGYSDIWPNSIVELKSMGDRFSGNAFVSAVSHLIEDGNWTTEASFGMDEEWFASRPKVNPLPAAGLNPEFGGLMVGLVKKLDEDPENQSRIQVKLPLMQDDNSGIWARLSSYYATGQKGNFFIPEINDEVIIGFFNNDPSQPVILGSLYSSKNTAPYSLTAENNFKAIVTKAGNKIEFDDDKKIITIQTPDDNSITISDDDKGITLKDQNGNTVTTDTDGIILKDSNSNLIEMSVSGITIKSSKSLNLEAGTDVKISGINITNSAQAAMKSSGNASAEFSASGTTTIKGALVMIN